MYEGTVKWFSNQKGYGFIEYSPAESSDTRDLFVHFTGIDMEGYKTLAAGQKVSFSVCESNRGPQATDVRPLSDEDKRLADDFSEDFQPF